MDKPFSNRIIQLYLRIAVHTMDGCALCLHADAVKFLLSCGHILVTNITIEMKFKGGIMVAHKLGLLEQNCIYL